MVVTNDGGKSVAIDKPRFPIAISGTSDPDVVLSAAKTARKLAVISTLCVAAGDERCAVALDTTGLDPETDEIIGLCILDRSCAQVVYWKRFKPLRHDSWRDAQNVNGVAPEDVAALGTLDENLVEIQDIVDSYGGIVAYNAEFVAGFLGAAGIDLSGVSFSDPMVEYAHYRAGCDGNPAFVSLSQALSEIDGSPISGHMDIAAKARYVSSAQSFLDTYYAAITERFCPEGASASGGRYPDGVAVR